MLATDWGCGSAYVLDWNGQWTVAGAEILASGIGSSSTRYATTALSADGRKVVLGVPASQAKGGVKVFDAVKDYFPLDASESYDTDLDGVGDNSDAFPADATETIDTDSDGTGNNADSDDDGDGVADTSDASTGCL